MNQSFRVIFQAASGTYVAVSELTKSKGKTKSSRTVRHAVVAAVLALGSVSAMASESCDLSDGTSGIKNSDGICVIDVSQSPLPGIGARYAAGGGTASDANSVAIGTGARTTLGASGTTGTGVAVGLNSLASQASVAIGPVAIAGVNSVALGNSANAEDSSVAVGTLSIASGATSAAFGRGSHATGDSSVALGFGSVADRDNSVSVGTATAQRQITNLAAGTAATDAVNFGQLTSLSTTTATGLSTAQSNIVNNTNSIANLSTGLATTNNNVTINTTSLSTLSSQINSGGVGLVQVAGAGLTVGALAGGTSVDFTGTAGLRTLTGVQAGSLAAGSTEAVNGAQLSTSNSNITTNTTNISALTTRMGTAESNINDLADQIGSGTVGLVQQAAAGANVALTVGANTDGTEVNFAGTRGARTLSGVADGVAASDAATFGQLTTTNNNVAALDGRVGIAETNITAINTTLADLGAGLNGAVVYNADKSAVALGGVNGTLINNLAAGLVGAGSMQAVNGGQLFSMKADLDAQLQNIIDNADAAIGIIGDRLDGLTGVVGEQGDKLNDLDDRVGTIETGIADGTIGGGGGGVNPAGNAQVGVGADASGKNSSAIGSGAVASGENSTAVGANSSATAKDSTALGADSKATGTNSVAIGAGSVADRDNSVSFGSAGNERQLTNIADGTAPTDAVNKRQLDGAIAGVNDRIDRLDTRVDEMGAMSSAQAQMAMSTAGLLGNNRLGVGIGAQNGQSALALGYQRVYGQGTRTLSFGGAASTRGTVSFGAGAGFAW
ncbi:ESPR-type extended signal peptide-containing protein [Collimonas pratensis]|uniref:ESPR-type extended signal peptide-containing protein n=1 Tax=Collimonas pratensis TaxID=279113 RepID=UPI0009EDD9C7|nr:ESPR-type extended signal peptide-containing protein [Collimonas pratensis]